MKKLLKLDKIGIPSLAILILMISIGPFGDTEYAPSLPRIAHELHVHYDMVQYTMTSYLAGYAISQLFYGPLSDKFGRKPIMLIGGAVFVLGSLICLTSFTIGQLIGGRFVQAVGACAGGVISNASVRDAYPPEEREHVYAKVNAAFAVAPALGPIVGSLLDEYFGWHVNFLLLFILSFILLICVWLFFPETNVHRAPNAMDPKKFFGHYFSLFKDPYYFAYVFVMGLCIGVVYCSLVGAPGLVIEVLKLNAIWILPIAGGVLAGFIIGSIFCNYITRVCQDRWVLFWGLTVMLITSIVYEIFAHVGLVATNIYTTLIPIAVIFGGIAMVIPIATAEALEPFDHITGTASAMVGFFQMGVASIATACLGLFPDAQVYSMPHMFTILSFVAMLTYALLVLARPNKERARV